MHLQERIFLIIATGMTAMSILVAALLLVNILTH